MTYILSFIADKDPAFKKFGGGIRYKMSKLWFHFLDANSILGPLDATEMLTSFRKSQAT